MKIMIWSVILMIILSLGLVCSLSSSWISNESKSMDVKAGHVQCSNNSASPTWFTCDTKKTECHCGDSHNNAVVCVVSVCVVSALNQPILDHVFTTVQLCNYA